MTPDRPIFVYLGRLNLDATPQKLPKKPQSPKKYSSRTVQRPTNPKTHPPLFFSQPYTFWGLFFSKIPQKIPLYFLLSDTFLGSLVTHTTSDAQLPTPHPTHTTSAAPSTAPQPSHTTSNALSSHPQHPALRAPVTPKPRLTPKHPTQD